MTTTTTTTTTTRPAREGDVLASGSAYHGQIRWQVLLHTVYDYPGRDGQYAYRLSARYADPPPRHLRDVLWRHVEPVQCRLHVLATDEWWILPEELQEVLVGQDESLHDAVDALSLTVAQRATAAEQAMAAEDRRQAVYEARQAAQLAEFPQPVDNEDDALPER